VRERLLTGVGIGLSGGLIAVLPLRVALVSIVVFGLFTLGVLVYRSRAGD
jgi:hypothetical protein